MVDYQILYETRMKFGTNFKHFICSDRCSFATSQHKKTSSSIAKKNDGKNFSMLYRSGCLCTVPKRDIAKSRSFFEKKVCQKPLFANH